MEALDEPNQGETMSCVCQGLWAIKETASGKFLTSNVHL